MLIYNYNFPCASKNSDSIKEKRYIFLHESWKLGIKPEIPLCDATFKKCSINLSTYIHLIFSNPESL